MRASWLTLRGARTWHYKATPFTDSEKYHARSHHRHACVRSRCQRWKPFGSSAAPGHVPGHGQQARGCAGTPPGRQALPSQHPPPEPDRGRRQLPGGLPAHPPGDRRGGSRRRLPAGGSHRTATDERAPDLRHAVHRPADPRVQPPPSGGKGGAGPDRQPGRPARWRLGHGRAHRPARGQSIAGQASGGLPAAGVRRAELSGPAGRTAQCR